MCSTRSWRPGLPGRQDASSGRLETAIQLRKSQGTSHIEIVLIADRAQDDQLGLGNRPVSQAICRCPYLWLAYGYATGSPAMGRSMGARLARA